MKFNEKLKYLREAKGFTQDEIASKLSIARQSVSKWEQGINEPDFDTLKKLCVILDCSIEELIDDDKEIVTSKEEKREKIYKRIYFISSMLLIFTFLSVFIFLSYASDTIIIHWDTHANPSMGSRWFILINLIPPFVGGLVVYLIRHLCLKSPVYRKYQRSMYIGLIVATIIIVAVTIALSVVMTWDYHRGEHASINLTGAFALAFIIAIAPFTHSKFNKRNGFFGFRTGLTLSSEVAWNKINNFASIALTCSALVGFILSLIFIEKLWAFLFILIILLGVMVSLIYHEIVRHELKQN